MKIVDFVRPDLVVPDLAATDKGGIIEELAEHIASRVPAVDREKLALALAEREKLASTGIDQGVAIPHARVPGVARPVATLLRLEAPVAFDAVDGRPVDLVFGLLSPEHAGAAHLHALAAISRLMRDEQMHTALVQAPGPEAIYGLLCNVIDRDAA